MAPARNGTGQARIVKAAPGRPEHAVEGVHDDFDIAIPSGFYLYPLGVVACLALAFGLQEWGKELALSALLTLIIFYIARDVFDKR